MALVRYEGFDHETSAADLYAGILSTLICTGAGQSASLALSTSTQYSVGQSLAITATSASNTTANAIAVMPISPGSNNLIVGAAVSLSPSFTNGAVIGFTNNNVGQVYCLINAGALRVYCGDPTGTSVQLSSTINNTVASLGWAYVEMQAVIAPSSAGSVTVQINGSVVFQQSSLTTSADGTTGCTGVLVGTVNTAQTNNGFTSYFDDLYAIDNTGGSPYNTFLGPVRVITQFPTANGSITSFTGLAHHPNWQNVGETDMDSDATYNYSNQTGAIDTFTSTALPGSSSRVYAVKVTGAGRIDDSGIRTVQTYLKSGTAVALGASNNLVGSYQYFSDIYTLDPNTTSAWTPSGVNLIQFGYKLVPSPGSPIALGSGQININVSSTITQITTITAQSVVGPFQAIVLMILPNLLTSTRTIGPISGAGTAAQGVTATALVSLPITGNGHLSFGLLLAGTISLPLSLLATLQQIGNVSATITLMSVHSGAQINQGTGLNGTMTIRPYATGSVSQAVNFAASAMLQVLANISAVQSNSAIGSGLFGKITASGSISGAAVSNIHIGLAAWQSSHAYTAGQRVASTYNGITNAYQANSSGTSSTTAPNGTGTAFTDGSLTWKYLSHVDFSDLPTWANSIPQTLTQPVIGLLWNDGTITTTTGTPFLTLGSQSNPRVTSSVNTITLQPAPGEGIRDSLALGSTALAFNTSKGVSFTLPSGTGGVNYFDICDPNVIFNGLQFLDPNSTSGSTIIQQETSSTVFTLQNCIIDGYAQSGGAWMIQGGTGTFQMTNCLVIDRQGSSTTSYAGSVFTQSAANHIVNCTIIAPNSPTTYGSGIVANSAAALVRNTIIMGYPSGRCIAGIGGQIAQVDHCLFSTSDPGSAAIDNGGNLYSKVATNQFNSATTDFRLKTGADAIDAAVTDTTDIPTADDIAGTHRPQGAAWDIGCWE
jgi:hypothetical protein